MVYLNSEQTCRCTELHIVLVTDSCTFCYLPTAPS